MGGLAAWVCYGRNHSQLTGISEATAKKLRDARPGFVQFFGGEEYIPEHEGRQLSFSQRSSATEDSAQQTFKSALDGADE